MKVYFTCATTKISQAASMFSTPLGEASTATGTKMTAPRAVAARPNGRSNTQSKIIEPTRDQLPSRRGGVTWSHPAFANKHVFIRNDKELRCIDLSAK